MKSADDINHDEVIPMDFHLSQNYPNPFNTKTTIKYCVGYKIKVDITIYNSKGNMIKKLVDEIKEAGTYEVEFSVDTDNNNILTDETYYYRFKAGDFSNTKTMKLNKNLFKEA